MTTWASLIPRTARRFTTRSSSTRKSTWGTDSSSPPRTRFRRRLTTHAVTGQGWASRTITTARGAVAKRRSISRKILTVSYLYELPFGAGKRYVTPGAASKVVGGWRMSGIQSYAAGVPLSLSVVNTLPIFNGLLRPNVVSGVAQRAVVGAHARSIRGATGGSILRPLRRRPRLPSAMPAGTSICAVPGVSGIAGD